MAETSREPKAVESAFWSWLGSWVLFFVLGSCVVLGAFAASRGEEPGNYTAGMVLILAALALAFLRLKQSFDEGSSSFGNFLFVDSMVSLVIAIPLFVVIGLAGLFIASAWPSGSLHTGGIALFVASGVIVFLDIKQVFDHQDTR